MRKNRKIQLVVSGKRRGVFLLPAEDAEIYLNPTERTLYRLFLAHPEGIAAENLLQYWQELQQIYAQESRYDDSTLRDNAMESLCAESKTVFYSNISRLKKIFVTALGARAASGYIIKRWRDGLYRTRATLSLPL
jgi:hypothetical protein